MDPFELFESQGIYKVVMLYFSRRRGLAIVGRNAVGDHVEVVQLTGEVDPGTGNFTALDYSSADRVDDVPVISKRDFEKLVAFVAEKIDDQTHMSVIEPELIRSVQIPSSAESAKNLVH